MKTNAALTSKRRVLAALAHRQPDRVPLGEIGIDGPIVEAVLGRSTYYRNRAVWGLLREAGFGGYHSIQEQEPLGELKRVGAGRMALMGGVSCRTLNTGTPEQVRDETCRAIDIRAPGRGSILASSHSLHAGVRLENVDAMLRTWRSSW